MLELLSVISEAFGITSRLPSRTESEVFTMYQSPKLFLVWPFQNAKTEGQGKPHRLDSNGQEVVVNRKQNTFPAANWSKGEKSHIEETFPRKVNEKILSWVQQ